MRKLVITMLVLLSLLLSGCTQVVQQEVKGSGKVASEDRSVSGFSGVDLATLGDLTITLGDQEALKVEAEDNLLPYIETVIKNGTLTIQTKEAFNINPTLPIKYALTVKSLDSLATSSLGSIIAPALQAKSFTARVSSAGNINLAGLTADSLDASLSSLGGLTIESGLVGKQKISLSSSGNYTAGEVKSQTAQVELSSLGSATLWVTDTLTGQISSSGNINYYGSPQVDIQTSSMGKAVAKGNK
jgi:hypothetical protein